MKYIIMGYIIQSVYDNY